MLFPTLAFAVFFLFVYLVSWSLDRENGRRKLFLLLASWFFYAQWDWRFVGLLIASARAAVENELHRYLVTQTLDAYFDAFPTYPNERFSGISRAFRLPPLQSVSSITYVDTDGVTQTLAADQYLVDAKSQPGRIEPAYGVSWPSTREQANAVIVRFIAGYGAAAAVPQCIKNWMLIRIKTLWENREQIVVGTNGMVEIPPAFVNSLLDSERVYGRAFA